MKQGYFTWKTIKRALFLPITIHGLYNWPVLAFDHNNASDLLKLLSTFFWFGILIYLVIKFKKILKEVKNVTTI